MYDYVDGDDDDGDYDDDDDAEDEHENVAENEVEGDDGAKVVLGNMG